MSRNEDITTAIWEDLADLTPEAKLVYIWSFTNEHNGMSGLYKVREATISYETGLSLDAVRGALRELSTASFLFYVDQVMFVRTRVRRLRSKSPTMAKSVAKDLQSISVEHPLRVRFLEVYGPDSWLREALSGTYRDGIGTVSENPVGKADSHTVSGTSQEVPGQGEGEGTSSGSSEKVDLPLDFPAELRPHLRVAFRVLRDLALRHHSKAVAPLPLAAVVMARSHKPIVRAAYDCAAHWDGGSRRAKDVVAAYRNWLDRTDDLAGFEQLGPNGLPAGNGSVCAVRADTSSLLRDMDNDSTWTIQPSIIDAEVVEDTA